MRSPSCWICLPLVLALTADVRAGGGKLTESELAAEYKKALSKLPERFPDALDVRAAAKSFTDAHGDAQAVAFLKKTALAAAGRDEQSAAFIGLALLAGKHDTVPFLKSHIGDKDNWLRSASTFLAVSFLPAKDARAVAEGVVSDGKQKWQRRIEYLFLLRAVGDQKTVEKLEKMERANVSPRELEVRDRTVWFLKQRLALKQPAEQELWARQELLFLQVRHYSPGFRSIRGDLNWAAKQIHRHEKDISVGLLKARLSLEPASSMDHNIGHDVPLTAMIAGLQKNKELLPLLDQWAARDLGYISSMCQEVAKQLRGQEKR